MSFLNNPIARNVPYIDGTVGVPLPVAAWRGCCIGIDTGFTLNVGLFRAGDVFSLLNLDAAPVIVAQGAGLAQYLAGGLTTGARTLAAGALVSYYWDTAASVRVIGAGVT